MGWLKQVHYNRDKTVVTHACKKTLARVGLHVRWYEASLSWIWADRETLQFMAVCGEIIERKGSYSMVSIAEMARHDLATLNTFSYCTSCMLLSRLIVQNTEEEL